MTQTSSSRSSFLLFDTLSFPEPQIYGRLLVKSEDEVVQWRQVFVLLVENTLMWIVPPSTKWSSLDLTNATVEPTSKSQSGFVIQGSRESIQFLCKTSTQSCGALSCS